MSSWLTPWVLVLMSLGAGYFYTSIKIKSNESRFPPLGNFIEAANVRTSFLRAGKGQSFVFLHGAHGSAYDFKLSILEDAQKNYEIIVPERPGFGYSGRSGKKPMTLESQAEWLHAFLEKIVVRRPILAGHSLGAALALKFAVMYPQEAAGLLLLSPYVRPFEGPSHPMHYIPVVPILGELYMQTWFLPVAECFVADGLLRKVFDPHKVPARYREAIRALALRPKNYKANAEDIRRFSAALKKLSGELREIRIPIAVLHGEMDRIAPFGEHGNYLKERLPHVELTSVPEAGHQLLFTHPGIVLSALADLSQKTTSLVHVDGGPA